MPFKAVRRAVRKTYCQRIMSKTAPDLSFWIAELHLGSLERTLQRSIFLLKRRIQDLIPKPIYF